MGGADKARSYSLTFEGRDDYEWGEVPAPFEIPDGDPYDGDCSGFTYAFWRTGGVPDSVINGRQTADAYYHMGTRISPSNAVCGDYIVLLDDNGHAHHIIACIGKGETMEARGEAYGYERHTVAYCMARDGAVCMRMPHVHDYFGDLGATTAPVLPPVERYFWSIAFCGNHANALVAIAQARKSGMFAKEFDFAPGVIRIHGNSAKAGDIHHWLAGRRIHGYFFETIKYAYKYETLLGKTGLTDPYDMYFVMGADSIISPICEKLGVADYPCGTTGFSLCHANPTRGAALTKALAGKSIVHGFVTETTRTSYKNIGRF